MSKKVVNEFESIRISTVIGENTTIEGNLKSTDSIRIDGTVNGDVHSEAIVVVDTKGIVNGDVVATSILIAGNINGNATATSRTEITSTGKIFGDITTKTLAIDEKAIFVGQCNMNRTAEDEDEE